MMKNASAYTEFVATERGGITGGESPWGVNAHLRNEDGVGLW